MEICPICLEEMNEETISTINCNHSLCNSCIEILLDKKKIFVPCVEVKLKNLEWIKCIW